MQVIVKHRQRWVAIMFWSGIGTFVALWLGLRRQGFSTSYIRCYYLNLHGEYKMILEPGTTPANVHLPPHLRLDRRSYLDHSETELALPPQIDVALQEKSYVQEMQGNIPKSERTDVHTKLGPFKVHSIVMTPGGGERYIKRRLGPSPTDAEELAKEEAERIAKAANEAK